MDLRDLPVPGVPSEILWGERAVRSVANLTRQDGEAFFRIAAEVPLRAVEALSLSQANEGLTRLREGRLQGAPVLAPGPHPHDS